MEHDGALHINVQDLLNNGVPVRRPFPILFFLDLILIKYNAFSKQ